jgi:alanine dehydrogenase
MTTHTSTQSLKLISEEDVKTFITVDRALQVNQLAFTAMHRDLAFVPKRLHVNAAAPVTGTTLFKPCRVSMSDAKDCTDVALGIKVVSVRPDNKTKGLPTVPATILLLDHLSGLPLALLESTFLTAIRTAAGSAVATRIIANPTATKLVVFGAGLQAREHIRAMIHVRPTINVVTIVNRTVANADRLAQDLANAMKTDSEFKHLVSHIVWHTVALNDENAIKTAVHGADIICTTTNSYKPVFDSSCVGPGTHINAIGSFVPAMQELPSEVVLKANPLIIDTPSAVDAGCLSVPNVSVDSCVTLGEYLVKHNCQTAADSESESGNGSFNLFDANNISIFKSVGTAVQDITTAHAVYCAAVQAEVEAEY